jgi:hypothetical protein
MDGRRLWPPHDVERHGLMCIAAEASDFEISVTSIQGITQGGRWLGRSLVAKHARIPRLAGKAVGFLARLGGALSRRPDRTAVNGFA